MQGFAPEFSGECESANARHACDQPDSRASGNGAGPIGVVPAEAVSQLLDPDLRGFVHHPASYQLLLHAIAYGYSWNFLQFLLGADRGFQELHHKVLAPTKQGRILDFGCSTGNASAIFKGYDYTGIDIDPSVIEFRVSSFGNTPR